MDASKHNRIYSVLLTLLAFGFVLSLGTLGLVRSMNMAAETADAAERAASVRILTYVMYINGCLAAFGFATVALRFVKPDLGRVFTRALNILLLVGFPLGTALGIYGLWKVDREPTKSA